MLLLGGFAVFVFGNIYYDIFPTNGNQVYLLALTTTLLMISLLLKRNPKMNTYWRAVYALFIASAATLFLNTGLLNLQDRSMHPLKFMAVDKFSQFLHIVPLILVLTLVRGGNLGEIFVKAGNWKRGLTFGLLSFLGFGILAVITQWRSLEVITTLPGAIFWSLLWVLANATMEELWFRGIFLREYEGLVGRKTAILLTALVFGASHINATYAFPGGGLVFGLVVFGLGWVGAHAMLKDDSFIGPVLFHAGYDLIVIVSVLNTV
jgi:membrane protease YdiL (CAAX protease family)